MHVPGCYGCEDLLVCPRHNIKPDPTNETFFECRTCGNGASGSNDGRIPVPEGAPRWRTIEHIDGRCAICPTCVEDPTCLDGLIGEGYDNASISVSHR
jgi:hypothetical protein